MNFITIFITLTVISINSVVYGCQFYPVGEYLRFVRVPENLQVGGEVLQVQVYPKQNLTIQPIDKKEDIQYFTYHNVNKTTISVRLAHTLEELVDRDNPQNVLKFRLVCEHNDGDDTISSYLSVTVYVEDINDHAPTFIDAPYHITVDELTPVGLTIFRGIQAFDRDKPNTPNSDVQYSITAGDTRGRFALESSHRALLVVKKPLDYDSGDREFRLTITATDRGSPSKSTNTTMTITILDNDDLNPKFTQDIYKTQILEFYPITGNQIHQELKFKPPIFAYDQDIALDAPIRYDIVAGNERRLFALDPKNGTLFLEKEIDLDMETRLPGNTFILQLQASQIDNLLKTALARVEIEVIDINDNLPEFEVDFYNISIVENLPNGFSVLQVVANDRDQGENGEFAFVLNDRSGAFNLDSRTGWLTVRDQSVLDREKQQTLSMKVYAKEKEESVITNGNASSSVTVHVTLLDANDNNPMFIPSNLYEFSINNDVKLGYTVGAVKAVDPDLGRNGMVLYDLQKTSNKTGPLPFGIDAQTGRITVTDVPLIEGRHALFVEASDQPANPSERRFSLAVVTVDVIRPGFRAEDDLPDFVGAPYEFWVGGNVGIGTSVGQIRINEAARKSNVVYDLLHSYHDGVPFAVEERSGTITVISELDRFHRQLYDFEAVITNEKDLTLVTNVTIHVVDPDDERGILMKGTSGAPIEFRVRENMSGALIGRLFYQNMTKNTTSKSLRFVIANQPDVTDYIAISQDGTLYTKKGLDREERDTYRLTVIAEYNKGFLSGAGIYQVTVHVDDENDNAPIFTQSFYEGKIKENSPRYTEVQMSHLINATDKDKGVNAQFTLTLFGDGQDLFQVNQTSGKIIYKGTKDGLDRESKPVYNFRLIARDKGSLSSEVKLTINIEDENDNAPTFLQMVILPDQGVKLVEYDEMHANLTTAKNNFTDILTMNSNNQVMYFAPLISLPENIQIGTPIVRLLANDRDFGDNAHLTYNILSETIKQSHATVKIGPRILTQFFMIQPATGEVIVARTLPAETEFRLNISATDHGGLSDNVTIRLTVKDINDHAPTFKQPWYSFDALEARYTNKILGTIEAVDSDFGENANISYSISDYENLPFSINARSGVLTINGELDREINDRFTFTCVAEDNAPGESKLRSFVDVEVNVLDVNDNAPQFYGYDKLISTPHPESSTIPNHNFEAVQLTPIYFATVVENSPIGTVVTKIFANDSDFPGNGNGLLLFDIPHRKNHENLFAIDSKEGVVTTIGKLDYELQNTYNITIIASDLGSPSLSSTCLLIISVIDIPDEEQAVLIRNIDRPVFSHRYYEVEVEENIQVPLKLLTLNITEEYKDMNLQYNIVVPSDDNKNILKMFKIDSQNGTLYLIKSPDREQIDKYEIIVRVDKSNKAGRGLMEMVYPIGPERLSEIHPNEAKVIVRILDLNDNFPKFETNGRPIVAAIPSSANFGYQILRLQATDADSGLNGEIRYQILGRSDDQTRRFAIDPLTGQVRSVVSFARDAGRVFGFDVKATDRRGADDGKSSIANVFVYVLDEEKQLIMVMGSQPMDVEKSMDNITLALYNVTGYDVRIRKLEPHTEHNLVDSSATDMFLYAVDPLLNVIIDMNQLESVLHEKQVDIKRQLKPYKVLDIGMGVQSNSQIKNQRFILSTLEVIVIILGCVIFVVALIAALCISCTRHKRRKASGQYFGNSHHHRPVSTTLGYSLGAPGGDSGTLIKPPSTNSLYPLRYGEMLSEYTTPTKTDPSYIIESHHSNSPGSGKPRLLQTPAHHQRFNESSNTDIHFYNSNKYRGQYGGIIRGNIPTAGRRSSVSAIDRALRAGQHIGMETSIASLHSSGKDSGIVDGAHDHHNAQHLCHCGQSTSHSSEESSNSYEDSLQSMHRDLCPMTQHHRSYSSSGRRFSLPPNDHHFERIHQSFRDDIMRSTPMIHRMPIIHSGHHSNGGRSTMLLATGPTGTVAIPRRHSERVLLACPVPPN